MKISRSEQKRRIKEVEKLVMSLTSLSALEIRQLPCSDEIKELASEIPSLKGGARKRQIKFITKLIKNDDLTLLYEFIAEKKGSELSEKKQFHEVEYLRDSLLDEALARKKESSEHGMEWGENWNSTIVRAICEELPAADSSTLLRLSYLFAQTRNPRHSREIFRYLYSIKEQERLR